MWRPQYSRTGWWRWGCPWWWGRSHTRCNSGLAWWCQTEWWYQYQSRTKNIRLSKESNYTLTKAIIMRTALAPSQGMVRLEMLLTDPTTSKMLTSTWEDGSVSVLRQWLYLDSADDEQGDVQGGDSQAFTQTTRVNSGGGQVPGNRV